MMGLGDLQLPFLLLIAYCSVALLVYLGELLVSPSHFYIREYKLVFCGLLGCLSVTFVNLCLFMALLFRSEGEQDWVIAWDVFGIKTEREINWELGVENKAYAYAMLGYGAVTSYIFIVGCLIKYIGGKGNYFNLMKYY